MTTPRLIIKKMNEVDIKVLSEAGIAFELAERFTYLVPDAKFHPLVKIGKWDGKIRLFNTMTRRIYGGLLEDVLEFAKDFSYDYQIDFDYQKDEITEHELNRYININRILFPDNGTTPRDYQLSGVLTALNAKKTILLSATSSGKSLMIFLILNWFKTYQPNFKFLLVVPTISLVYQMKTDFESYGPLKFSIHTIAEGADKDNDADVVIATWQSIYGQDENFFKPFTGVIGDEAHTFKAKSLISIMTKLINAEVRIGTTGTLDDAKSNMMTLKGLFGPVSKVITSAEMMERGFSAQLKIQAVVLNYPEEEKEFIRKRANTYPEESRFIMSYEKRNDFICNLVLSKKGNTLVLFKGVAHGKLLAKKLADKSNRKVFLVYGLVKGKIREDIRQQVEKEDDAIIVASFLTFSTGINIKRLHNIVFANPYKSKIKVLQSIGRGLRKGYDKDDIVLTDIVDNLSHKKYINHTLRQFKIRVEYYDKEKFDYTIHTYSFK